MENIGKPKSHDSSIAQKVPRTRAAGATGEGVPTPAIKDSIDYDGEASNTNTNTSVGDDTNSTVFGASQDMSMQGGRSQTSKKKKKKKPRPVKVWTSAREERLIELYKERLFMYDMAKAGYHNRCKKSSTLKYIADQLGVPGMYDMYFDSDAKVMGAKYLNTKELKRIKKGQIRHK